MTQQEKDNLYDELREQRHADADDRRDRLYDEWKEQRKESGPWGTVADPGVQAAYRRWDEWNRSLRRENAKTLVDAAIDQTMEDFDIISAMHEYEMTGDFFRDIETIVRGTVECGILEYTRLVHNQMHYYFSVEER